MESISCNMFCCRAFFLRLSCSNDPELVSSFRTENCHFIGIFGNIRRIDLFNSEIFFSFSKADVDCSVHIIPAQISLSYEFNFFTGKIPLVPPPACYNLSHTWNKHTNKKPWYLRDLTTFLVCAKPELSRSYCCCLARKRLEARAPSVCVYVCFCVYINIFNEMFRWSHSVFEEEQIWKFLNSLWNRIPAS